ncbi:hypothetical protein [Actinoplanes sp. NPDC051851]|uniref:hypothetical protein n=1 Tax=Actinoplanes sp. NPDC051851 TaxID=3154753 RepID=UPI00342532C4
MRSMLQLVGGVAVAGAVAAGSTAFTASNGLTNGAGTTQFIGGTVSQTVTGASLSAVTYAFNDATKTQITGVTLTFTDSAANGKAVTLTPTGTGYGSASADQFYCPTVSGTSVTCITALTSDGTHAAASYYTGLTSMQIQVA